MLNCKFGKSWANVREKIMKQLSSGEEGNVEKSKLFTSKDLEKATDRYNKNRILSKGGQGIVYKGMLANGRIVAIKVSSIVDEDNIKQFINEEKHLFDILDDQVGAEGEKEKITKVANLAKRCLNLSGRKRPTMREVLEELEGVRIPNGASSINELDEEGE
ncbi:hypothetical protein LguiB_006027 [Lonicera macranthoides]